jgi:hypothetical protein
VNPRQAPDLVRDLVAALSKLIEAAPKEHRDGLRAIVYDKFVEHLERIGKGQPLELPNEHEGPLSIELLVPCGLGMTGHGWAQAAGRCQDLVNFRPCQN